VAHQFPFLDHPLPLAFAHRGGASAGLENTMAAFERAVQLGYRYLETDARVTADGALVAFHDRRLARVTGRTGTLAGTTWAELSRTKVAGTEAVPLLEDVVDRWPEHRFTIDVKTEAVIEPLIAMVRRTGIRDRICVGSFSGARLAKVRAALGPRLCTSLAPREVLRLWRASGWRPTGARGSTPGVPCAQVPPRVGAITLVDRRLVDRAHALGMQVHVWTINDRARMNQLLDLGVDGLMTDDLLTLREVYSARGLWFG
jgi:glycerophosphoryl diester phosphodiesterase